MKAAFLFAFNVLRNISLVIVVFAIGSIYLLSNDPSFQQRLADKITMANSETSALSIAQPVNGNQMMEVTVQSASQPMNENKSFVVNGVRKFKIEVPYGVAYINPADIMSIDVNAVHLINGQKIKHKQRLKDLKLRLDLFDEHQFFRLKSELINCYFVNGIVSNHTKGYYQKYVRLNEDIELTISDDKARELTKLMQKFSL